MADEEYKHRFSVFTATYNRSKGLKELHEDLCRQTFKDFEWVVVNDGSTDDTDEVMQEIIAKSPLDIVYVPMSKNGGKHKAWREGLKAFSGRYVVTADDDDPVLPEALSIHNRHWQILEKQPNYNEFWEVRTRSIDPQGNLVGDPLPEPWFDSDFIEVCLKLKVSGEMNGSRKVEILRSEANIPTFLFEDKCNNYPEGLRWIKASRKYKTRFVPDITRVYEPNPLGLINHKKSERALYSQLVDASYNLLNNRDLFLKYNLKLYFLNIAMVGYKSAQLKEDLGAFYFCTTDRILTSFAKQIFTLYLKLKK